MVFKDYFSQQQLLKMQSPLLYLLKKAIFYSSSIFNLIKPLYSVLPFHLTAESSHKCSFPGSQSTMNRKANCCSSEQRHSHTLEYLCLGVLLQKNTCPQLFKDSTSATVQCIGRHEQPFFYLVYSRTMIHQPGFKHLISYSEEIKLA